MKYSNPLKDISVPTKMAAKPPPSVNTLVLSAPKKIRAIIRKIYQRINSFIQRHILRLNHWMS